MSMLVLNCGSSSIKFSLFDEESDAVLLEGLAEWLGGSRDAPLGGAVFR